MTPVPLTLRERAIVVLLVLAALAAVAVGFWVWSSSSRDEDVAAQLFSRLGETDYENAYALLTPELQAELKSPGELERRWTATGLTGVALIPVCAGMSPGTSTLKMRATVTPASASPALPFVLGAPLSDRSCKGKGPMPLVVLVKDGKVAAVRLEPG